MRKKELEKELEELKKRVDRQGLAIDFMLLAMPEITNEQIKAIFEVLNGKRVIIK